MGLDPKSVGIGYAAGLATAYGVHKTRQYINRLQDTAKVQTDTSQIAGNRRYLNDLVAYCQRNHLFGDQIALSQILVEPRFILQPELVEFQDENAPRSNVFETIPLVHEYPYLHAYYNIHTIGFRGLENGDPYIVLLGESGSGRTSAFMSLILWGLGHIDLTPPPDPVESHLETQEKSLSDRERAEIIKRRFDMERQATEQLNNDQLGSLLIHQNSQKNSQSNVFKYRLPIYAHASQINLDDHYGNAVDPAEPLVRAVQKMLRWRTAREIPRTLYDFIKEGNAFIIIDGFDEIPEMELAKKLDWLKQLRKLYPQNILFASADLKGFGRFAEAGFTPIWMRPWTDVDVDTALYRWKRHWSQLAPKAGPIDAQAEDQLKAQSRNKTVFEWNVVAYQNLTSKTNSSTIGVTEALDGFISKRISKYAKNRSIISELAAEQLTAGRIRLNGDDEALLEQPDDLAGTTHSELTEKNRTKVIQQLLRDGLLQESQNQQYRFKIQEFAAYLASINLAQNGPALLKYRLQKKKWRNAFRYASPQLPANVIGLLLEGDNNIDLYGTLELLQWLRYSHTYPSWRNDLLRYAGNLFVSINQYTSIREKIAAALVGSRDEGAKVIFRRGLSHVNPTIKQLACLGLGGLRDIPSISLISKLTLDPNLDVHLSATLALGAIGAEDGLLQMTRLLEQPVSDEQRRAVCESFALNPELGYLTLFDAVQSENDEIRRAAIFGLGRINTSWAIIQIFEHFISEEAWFVRSATQHVMESYTRENMLKPLAYPYIGAVPWIRQWAESYSNEKRSSGFDLLDAALENPNPVIQRMALGTIAQLGLGDKLPEIYQHLGHHDPRVRDESYRALSMLETKTGIPLPSPLMTR